MEAAQVSLLDEQLKQLRDINTMKYYLAVKKEKKFTLWDSMDRLEEHNVKWNKPVRERQVPYNFIHMWNLMSKLN